MSQVSDSLSKLLRATKRISPLEAEEELRLFKQWQTNGDPRAKSRIIEASMRHVVSLAIMYRNYPIHTEDLVSEGSLGLMHALEKFKPEMGNRFITYAAYWIKAFMHNAILAYHEEIHTQGKVRSTNFYKYKRERNKAEAIYGKSEQADAYLAKSLQLTSNGLAKLKRAMEWSDISLETPISDFKQMTLESTLEFDGASPEDQACDKYQSSGFKSAVKEALTYLDKRERYIAETRLMESPEDSKSLADLGRDLGVSRERARQLETRAKKKLKVHLRPLKVLLNP
jgi:RNA polymerase sigma-32 factor